MVTIFSEQIELFFGFPIKQQNKVVKVIKYLDITYCNIHIILMDIIGGGQ